MSEKLVVEYRYVYRGFNGVGPIRGTRAEVDVDAKRDPYYPTDGQVGRIQSRVIVTTVSEWSDCA